MMSRISPIEAAAMLAGFRLADPQGQDSVSTVVSRSECFKFKSSEGDICVCLSFKSLRCWITAAAGKTKTSISDQLSDCVAALARNRGCQWLGFQTARRGLVRRAQSLGYQKQAIEGGWKLELAL